MMRKEILKEPISTEKIPAIIRQSPSVEAMQEQLRDYHDHDIAQSFEHLSRAERNLLYTGLDAQSLADIISYMDNPADYIGEIVIDKLADVINEMDADDAADLWEDIDESVQVKLFPMLKPETRRNIRLINSYDEDEIGSLITTNYICIRRSLTIRQAMHELVKQAGEKDNISTLYVVDDRKCFFGAIDLKDLIIARENVALDSIISTAYPYLTDHDKISDRIEAIKDYAEDSLPVLNKDRRIIGIITAQDAMEAVDDEMSEDYAKLAGLSAEEDLNESTNDSIKKRLPWLIILRRCGGHPPGGHLLPVPDSGHGRKRGHPIPGGDHPGADGREPQRRGQAPAGGQRNEGWLLQRLPAGSHDIPGSGHLHRPLQGIRRGHRPLNLRLRGHLPPGGHHHLQPRRYAGASPLP